MSDKLTLVNFSKKEDPIPDLELVKTFIDTEKPVSIVLVGMTAGNDVRLLQWPSDDLIKAIAMLEVAKSTLIELNYGQSWEHSTE